MKNHLSLAARILGLLVLLNGSYSLLTFVFILLSGEAGSFFLLYFLTITLFELVVGGYLLRGAPFLIEYAFRASNSDRHGNE